MKKEDPKKRMWRTLVRVHSLTSKGVVVIIPGWEIDIPVFIDWHGIPPAIFDKMEVGGRFHVGCNIGENNRDSLCFDNWEDE